MYVDLNDGEGKNENFPFQRIQWTKYKNKEKKNRKSVWIRVFEILFFLRGTTHIWSISYCEMYKVYPFPRNFLYMFFVK